MKISISPTILWRTPKDILHSKFREMRQIITESVSKSPPFF